MTIKFLHKMTLNFDKRIREITLKSSSLSGLINSKQLSKPIFFESSLERDFIYLLEFDTKVDKYLEQPLEIVYKDSSGKTRKYVPDFAISYLGDRPNEIIEIKYESTLKDKHDELAPKFKAAAKFCRKNKLVFKVITENYIRVEKAVELENFKFLSRYRNYFNNINYSRSAVFPMNPDLFLLHKKISQLQKCTVKSLVEYCSKDYDKKAELLFLTWCLIATNYISTDFTKKITTNSKIWHNK